MNGHMWLVIAVLDSMGLRVNRVKYVNYVSRRQEECAGRRKNVCKSPVARGSTACLRTWQKENVGGKKSWEKYHEMSRAWGPR